MKISPTVTTTIIRYMLGCLSRNATMIPDHSNYFVEMHWSNLISPDMIPQLKLSAYANSRFDTSPFYFPNSRSIYNTVCDCCGAENTACNDLKNITDSGHNLWHWILTLIINKILKNGIYVDRWYLICLIRSVLATVPIQQICYVHFYYFGE